MKLKGKGYLALLIGIVLAVVVGIIDTIGILEILAIPAIWLAWLLALIGLIVGILNLTTKDSIVFLVVTLLLVITGSSLALSFPILSNILSDVVIVAAAAALVVALKTIYALMFK